MVARRFRTTHVDSLQRGQALAEMLIARGAGVPVDDAGFREVVESRVEEMVERQINAGAGWVNDGEPAVPVSTDIFWNSSRVCERVATYIVFGLCRVPNVICSGTSWVGSGRLGSIPQNRI